MREQTTAAVQSAESRFDLAEARRRCLEYRHRLLDISQQVTALHLAPAFSCLEIVDLIYRGLMRPDSSESCASWKDGFLMSKGHGCLSQYVILEDLGVLSRTDLDRYCTPAGRLGAHPDYGVSGIEAATGSLGHGMGLATGMAYAERIKRTDRQTYLLLSDGEMQEGSSWESMMTAANLKLSNLVAFVDVNDFTGLDRVSEKHPAFYPLVEKIRAFGWEACEANGHDAGALLDAVRHRTGQKPFMVACRTVKGKGVSFMENVPIWHYRSPSKEEYARAKAELAEVVS